MPKLQDETPVNLKPYLFHGLDLSWSETDTQAKGDCPFCGKEGKLSVEIKTGVYRCWSCGTGTDKGGGNTLVFLRKLHDVCLADEEPLRQLADERKLVSWETLAEWGVALSPTTRDIVVPGYDVHGKLVQLYRYVSVGGKRKLLATAGMPHGVFGVPLMSRSRKTKYVCEGPWDAMSIWETLRMTMATGDKFVMTSNVENSLGANADVIGVPGCNLFQERWGDLVDKCEAVLCFDSDHPRSLNGKEIPPAGHAGLIRTANILATKSEGRPSKLFYLNWGPDGYDPSLAPGYDVRDALKDGVGHARCRMLGELLERIEPVPAEWSPGRNGKAHKAGEVGIECVPCSSLKDVLNAFRKALKWTPGLEKALIVMLASVTSTMAIGDQLWVRIISPPSSGKSTLCEAISVNRKYILPKSTFSGFVSGYDDGSGENHSPVNNMRDKTLIIKDGDALLKRPNLDQILSEARDLYDRVIRVDFRNKQSKDHEGLNLTIILCGTGALRVLDTSELGERFLTCDMGGLDPEVEDDILWRKVNQADQAMAFESTGSPESQHPVEMLEAMQLTGGYVAHLRQNAKELLSAVHSPEAARRKIVDLGKFVAFMRARPSTKQDEQVEREFATRLVSQLMRLAKCVAVVMNHSTIDDTVMETVTSVSMDSARGRTLDIARHLFEAEEEKPGEGLSSAALAVLNGQGEEAERKLLRFLRRIGAVEQVKVEGKVRWKLTQTMTDLYRSTME